MTEGVQLSFHDPEGQPLPVAPVRFGVSQLREQPDLCLHIVRQHVGGEEACLRCQGEDLDVERITAMLQTCELGAPVAWPVQVSFTKDADPEPPAPFEWQGPKTDAVEMV